MAYITYTSLNNTNIRTKFPAVRAAQPFAHAEMPVVLSSCLLCAGREAMQLQISIRSIEMEAGAF